MLSSRARGIYAYTASSREALAAVMPANELAWRHVDRMVVDARIERRIPPVRAPGYVYVRVHALGALDPVDMCSPGFNACGCRDLPQEIKRVRILWVGGKLIDFARLVSDPLSGSVATG